MGRNMQALTVAALGLVVFLLLIVPMVVGTVDKVQALRDQPRIEEDDPRWDCATMGNRICGPARLP